MQNNKPKPKFVEHSTTLFLICDRGSNPRVAKGLVVKIAGGVGMILANGLSNGEGLVGDALMLIFFLLVPLVLTKETPLKHISHPPQIPLPPLISKALYSESNSHKSWLRFPREDPMG